MSCTSSSIFPGDTIPDAEQFATLGTHHPGIVVNLLFLAFDQTTATGAVDFLDT